MTIRKVPVAEAMQAIETSADFWRLAEPSDWFAYFRRKMPDKSFWYLVERVEDGTGILDPICIHDGELGNGHHRLAVAILMGLDEILVDDSDWYSKASHASGEYFGAPATRDTMLIDALTESWEAYR